jgi:hypothetical protein
MVMTEPMTHKTDALVSRSREQDTWIKVEPHWLEAVSDIITISARLNCRAYR